MHRCRKVLGLPQHRLKPHGQRPVQPYINVQIVIKPMMINEIMIFINCIVETNAKFSLFISCWACFSVLNNHGTSDEKIEFSEGTLSDQGQGCRGRFFPTTQRSLKQFLTFTTERSSDQSGKKNHWIDEEREQSIVFCVNHRYVGKTQCQEVTEPNLNIVNWKTNRISQIEDSTKIE